MTIAFVFFRGFFNLTALSVNAVILVAISAVVFFLLFNLLYDIANKQIEKFKRRKPKKVKTTV